MKSIPRDAMGAALLLLIAGASAQAAETGWYFGVGAGGAHYADNIPPQIAAAYQNNNTYTLTSARMTDSSDTAAQVFAGYQFLPWLGVEVGYQDLGKARSFYSLKTLGPIIYPRPTLSGEYGVSDVNAAVVLTWPINEHFELLARGGIASTRLTYDENGFDVNAQPYSFHARAQSSTSSMIGVGAAWNFARHFSLRLDLDRSSDIGKTFALNPRGNGRFDHVDAYTVNLVWRP